tara:strand:- start:5988 stop:6263 length:276 start_codon:yes stop_codon:yes gene_type:complete
MRKLYDTIMSKDKALEKYNNTVKKFMGNLRSKHTDEEWDAMEEKYLSVRTIKLDSSLGIDKVVAKQIQKDIFAFGKAVVKSEYKENKIKPQ